MNAPTPSGFTRRALIAGGIGAGVAAALAGCSFVSGGGGGGGATGTLKFWDMPWGTAAYNTAGKKLINGYSPKSGLPKGSYQTIQWNNFFQTFSSAIASKTNPAASTGGGFQAYQFAEQGAIHMADDLVATMKKDGFYDDFLPGVVDALKTSEGYVALPWALDIRPMWYRKSIFEKAGVDLPTDWDSWRTAAAALKKVGAYGFAAGAGANNNVGAQVLVAMMINNGGGLFNADGDPDAVTDRNIEAMEFVQEFVRKGYIDPAATSYTIDNAASQWKSGAYAFGFDQASLISGFGDVASDFAIGSPLTGPHGDKGTLIYENNIMMYKNNPSDEGTEALVEYYLKNMHVYWDNNLIGGLPVLKSIGNSANFKKDANASKMLTEWQPVAKQFGTLSNSLSAKLASVDGSSALSQFTQTMLSGKGTAKAALETFQAGMKSVIK